MATAIGGDTTLTLQPIAPATREICLTVADRLEAETQGLANIMTAAVFREVPVYGASRTPDLERTVLKHSLDHVVAIARTIRTWTLPSAEELRFVRAQGALRATQQLPLNALLHSYRVGHRTVWARLVQLVGDGEQVLDAVLALTTLTLGYTDSISSALAEGYLEQQRLLVLERDRERRDLLETLLHGSLGVRPDLQTVASGFDLAPTAELLVIVSAGAGERAPGNESLTRAADVLRRHLCAGVAQPLVVVRQHEVVAVLPLGRTRPAAWARLARAAHAELSQRGDPWGVGVSTVCSGLAEVRRGYDEARQALDWARQRAGVTALFEMRVSDYVLEQADATARRIVPAAARRLFESTSATDQVLVETLLAYAEADMAVRVTAQRLAVHPNTVSYRLSRVRQLISRDPTRFSDLVELLAWARLCAKSQTAFEPATGP